MPLVRVALTLPLLLLLAVVRAQEDPASAAEAEWEKLHAAITPKIIAYRGASPEQRENMTLQREIAALGEFANKYSNSEPDFALSARVFLAAELLSGCLQKDQEAVQILRDVVAHAENAFVASLAALRAGKILLQKGDESALREITSVYRARKNFEQQFLEILEEMCARSALKPGRILPLSVLPLLDGVEFELADPEGRRVLLLFFQSQQAGSLDSLRAAAQIAETLAEGDVRVVAVSLDEERSRLEDALKDAQIEIPVAWEGGGWQSPAARKLGINTLPASFILDNKRIILHVDVPSGQWLSVLQASDDESDIPSADGNP